jgi:hypothetical protein
MNIPQIPDIEEIKRKMAEANMNFPEPVSYPDQLQAIRDLPPMNQMPTREEIQMAMQNMPTPIGANITQNPFQKINDILPQSTIAISFNHLQSSEIGFCATSTTLMSDLLADQACQCREVLDLNFEQAEAESTRLFTT